MIVVEEHSVDGTTTYRDTKRYWWLASVASPALPGLAALAILSGASPLVSLAPVIFYFGLVPILDALVGEDANNPPSEVVEALSEDQWYRILLHAAVPVLWFSFLACFVAIGVADLPLWSKIVLAVSAGVSSGAGLTIAHELGHKPNAADQASAKIVLALSGYGHFCIEHNRGHHVQVATPEDPASSRMGESVYRFAVRELPGAFLRGVGAERKRLEKKGFGFWTWRNDLLQVYVLSAVIAAVLAGIFGWVMLAFLALHHLVAWLQLTFANYVEHYGLRRKRLENGRYEACAPRHSWNTNHTVSNLMLFHLQRHSDHHANPLRPYQALRNFDDLPKLPSGYPGAFLLASLPPLWFRVMDPKVMAWALGEIDATNRVSGYQPKL